MIRALYTAASGMKAYQNEINNVGNNIANVNTVGYKKIRSSFKENLYSSIAMRSEEADEMQQFGNGVRVGRNITSFKSGILKSTDSPLDAAIDGEGFFTVGILDDNGQISGRLYTRNGSFRLNALASGQFRLETREGNPVLDSDGQAIIFNGDISEDNILIKDDGTISINQSDVTYDYARLGLVTFLNPDGLGRAGNSYFYETQQSGAPRGTGLNGEIGKVIQNHLEFSNVDLAEEITQLIMNQRAYQLNSRVLQTSDEMERLANNLRP